MTISKILVLGGVSAALIGSASIAVAGSDSGGSLNAALKSQLSSFNDAGTVVVPPSVQQQLVRSAAGTGLLDNVTWTEAVATPVAGSKFTAWVVPAGEKVCLIAPDPVDGYGVGCSTAAQVAAGEALLLMAAPAGAAFPSISLAVTPDGSPRPTVSSSDGKAAPLGRSANVSAAVVPAGGSVATFGKKWDLGAIQTGIERARR